VKGAARPRDKIREERAIMGVYRLKERGGQGNQSPWSTILRPNYMVCFISPVNFIGGLIVQEIKISILGAGDPGSSGESLCEIGCDSTSGVGTFDSVKFVCN